MCKVLQYFGNGVTIQQSLWNRWTSYRMIMKLHKRRHSNCLIINQKKCRESWQGFAWSWAEYRNDHVWHLIHIYGIQCHIIFYNYSYWVLSGYIRTFIPQRNIYRSCHTWRKFMQGRFIRLYYLLCKGGSKINASGAVYGLSDTKTASAPASLAPEELSKVRTDMMSFSKGFSQVNLTAPTALNMNWREISFNMQSLAIPHLLLLLQMRTVKEMTVVTMTKQQIFIPEIKLSASPNLMVSFYIPWIIMKEKQ